ncbi:ATP-grasp domain-containing protein [Oryzihumus sp.]
MRRAVLVTGAGGPAGRSLAAQLASRGYRVVCADMSLTGPGGEPAPWHVLPPAGHREFIGELLALARRVGADLVVPTVSEELAVVAAHGDLARHQGVDVLVSPWSGVVAANDKLATCLALEAAGVPVPAHALPSRLAATPELLDALGLPCLSKPRVGRGGRGVQVHDGPEAVVRRELEALSDNEIVQELVPGEEFGPNLWLGADPARDVVVVLRKTALRQGRVGNAVGVERVDEPAVGAVALAAARRLGLRGPVDVDVRLRADGTPVVLEVNARFGANSAHAPEVLDALVGEHGGAWGVAS